ncbi:MAG: hypothetical protein V8Q40_04995 [Anaerosacchariphilus sp.]
MAQKIRQSRKKIKYRLQNLQNCKIEGGWILKIWIEIIPVMEYNKKKNCKQ